MLVAAVALAASLVQLGPAPVERHPAAASPRPQTLYEMGRGKTIQAFAQDGKAVAWFAPSKNACNAINILTLSNGVRALLPDESTGAPNVTCRWEVVPPVGLALAGEDALWTLRENGAVSFDYVLGAGLGVSDARELRVKEVAHSTKGPGLWLGGIAGSGATLVYAVTNVAYVDEVGCLSTPNVPGACDMKIAGGGVYRVTGRKQAPIVEGPSGAFAVAASDTSVAYVPAATVGKTGAPVAATDSPIEVRDARTGALISRANPQGTPVAIALSATALATLERTPLGLALAWYDPATGSRLGSVPVPAGTNAELSAGDQVIVFRVGRSIRGVSIEKHKVSILATAAVTPIGLSIEGSRVAWAENVKGRGRIRALYVKGRG
jgi:hypothetical protein